ncbi:alkaline phosphatase family protein [Sulfobacillus harzensis]|uniref:Alkaline phosphatase family protein n=1 Tax=Sulfobacillus harzensis TaxID=2729629 RepID=A0A7Y0L4J7_9FIRM|nr:alkaline phosphatase family protein [Sulfobacillus harzensis]NMP23183.1 alkaline phosphatase family protein [Sulfobacillus harzensis]
MTARAIALPDVMPTALSLLTGKMATPMKTATPHGVGRIVVWTIDGLGYDQLIQALDWGLMPRLTALLATGEATARPIQSVFPSITPVALASLLTGTWPGEHGLIGRFIQLPDAPCIDTLGDGTSQHTFALLEETLDRRALKGDLHYRAVMEARLLRGTLTQLLHPMTENIVSYVSPLAMRPRMVQALCQPERGLSYVYWPYLDSTNHRRGPYSQDWADEMKELDRVLGDVVQDARGAGQPAWLWIVADHGHHMVHDVLPYRLLRDAVPDLPVQPLGCERVAGLALTAEQAISVDRAVRTLFEGKVTMRPFEAFVEDGAFGPRMRPDVSSRVGNWFLEATDGFMWAWDEEPKPPSVATHGGRSKAEMTIPFIEICVH